MVLKINDVIYSAGDSQRNVIYEVTYLRVIVDNVKLDDSFPHPSLVASSANASAQSMET